MIEKKIKELGSHLRSEKAIAALKVLKDELSTYIEPEEIPKQGKLDFIIPAEVAKNKESIAIFTDGACRGNPGPGSYGFLIQAANGEILDQGSNISNPTTNNKMELMGVIAGLERAQDMESIGRIFVYTDSKYVVDGMNSWVAGWKKRGWKKADNKPPENLEFWQRLDNLSLKLTPSFLWVKGHAGHPQNEYVDQLANIALDESGF